MKILLNARNIGCVGSLVEGPDLSVSLSFVSNARPSISRTIFSSKQKAMSFLPRVADSWPGAFC